MEYTNTSFTTIFLNLDVQVKKTYDTMTSDAKHSSLISRAKLTLYKCLCILPTNLQNLWNLHDFPQLASDILQIRSL